MSAVTAITFFEVRKKEDNFFPTEVVIIWKKGKELGEHI